MAENKATDVQFWLDKAEEWSKQAVKWFKVGNKERADLCRKEAKSCRDHAVMLGGGQPCQH